MEENDNWRVSGVATDIDIRHLLAVHSHVLAERLIEGGDHFGRLLSPTAECVLFVCVNS